MKKIVILTATRAEYGQLSPIIKKLSTNKEIDVRLVVTGAHLSREFGMTIDEIIKDGVKIDKEIEILMGSDTSVAISKTMALAMISFSEYFHDCKPDALMVLGDRYETLAVCIAAMNEQIPIIHLYGGEATEGLIDEAVRNAITKLSYLHFTSTDEYRNRVIQMGEHPSRVFKVGAMGVENALKVQKMSKNELEESLGYSLKEKYAVLTFHPVTLEKNTAKKQIMELIHALENYPDIIFLCTKANADMEGRIINDCLYKCSKTHNNVILVDSLGVKRYLSALSYAQFVIGNSSSGIIEAPSFKIPTINIGDRQKGRIQAKSIINCKPIKDDIENAINLAMSSSFRESISNIINPYGSDNASDAIVNVSSEYLLNNKFNIKKDFYTINLRK